MIYRMSVVCGMQFARKNGSCPGLNGWQGWGEYGSGRRFREGQGGSGRRFGLWWVGSSIPEREDDNALFSEVEEALLAVHVASNGSQELTDPNCPSDCRIHVAFEVSKVDSL